MNMTLFLTGWSRSSSLELVLLAQVALVLEARAI